VTLISSNTAISPHLEPCCSGTPTVSHSVVFLFAAGVSADYATGDLLVLGVAVMAVAAVLRWIESR
jgi:hypothetical protein